MKQLNRAAFLAVVCAVLIFSTQPILSQDSPEIPDPNFKPTNIGKSSEGVQPTYPEEKTQGNNQTDEYGEFRDNAVLSNLNNAANYVNVPHNAAFNENFDGSVEFWVNQTARTSGGAAVLSKNATFLFGVNTVGAPFCRIGGTVFTGTGTIPLGEWTHMAFVWSGGPTTFSVAFYINGALQNTAGPTAATYDLNTNALRIGASEQFASAVFNGQIDDVRFWTDARTATEIRDNRFTSLGDARNSNVGSALTSSSHYAGLTSSWTFGNTGTANDDISGFNGSFVGGATAVNVRGGRPIPYNFALMCPGAGATSLVTVPSSTSWNQNGAGSFDAWVYTTVHATKEICAKGNTSNTSFIFGMASSGKLYMRFGSTPTTNTDGVTIPLNTWTHVAYTWTGSAGNYSVRFYVNGTQSGATVVNAGTWNINTDPLTIGGGIAFAPEIWNGYIDEVRMWGNQLTQDQIRAYMWNSGRSGTMTSMVGCWNFDGSLLNYGTAASTNGSFNTGGTNNCRMSAYINENTTGAISTSLNAHKSVINRDISPNPFVGGFAMKHAYVPIPSSGNITNTLVVSSSGTVSSVELFLSIDHTFAGDLDITLTSPNGQVREITTDNGGGSDNGYLCFFVDGATIVSNADWLAPFSPTVGPEAVMGNFGGSPTNGTWTLSITDDAAGDSGTLKAWGLRLNGTVTAIEPVNNNIPNKFSLYQNYPNPFNPISNIKFDIAKATNVKLVVFDILGREVATLVNEYTNPGQYEVQFDGANFASGTYFFRIEAGDFTDIKKMVLVK